MKAQIKLALTSLNLFTPITTRWMLSLIRVSVTGDSMLFRQRGSVSAAKKTKVREVEGLSTEAKTAHSEGRDMVRIPGTTKIKSLIPPDRLLEDFRDKGT